VVLRLAEFLRVESVLELVLWIHAEAFAFLFRKRVSQSGKTDRSDQISRGLFPEQDENPLEQDPDVRLAFGHFRDPVFDPSLKEIDFQHELGVSPVRDHLGRKVGSVTFFIKRHSYDSFEGRSRLNGDKVLRETRGESALDGLGRHPLRVRRNQTYVKSRRTPSRKRNLLPFPADFGIS